MLGLSNLPHFPEDKYLSWDKDFMAVAKKSFQIICEIYLSYFLKKHSMVVPHQGASNEYPQHMFSLRNM